MPEEEESLSIKSPSGWIAGARGRHLSHMMIMCFMVSLVMAYLWQHEEESRGREARLAAQNRAIADAIVANGRKQDEAKDETVYVLSRNEQERKAMNLQMPDSLRRKMRRE